MKLINIEIQKYTFTDDWEIRVLFWKWMIAKFKIDGLLGTIIRK